MSNGGCCVRAGMVSIVASWFISPVVAGIFSGAVLLACRHWVFKVSSCRHLQCSAPGNMSHESTTHTALPPGVARHSSPASHTFSAVPAHSLVFNLALQSVQIVSNLALQAPSPLQRVLALMPLLFSSIVGTVLLLVLLQSELTAAWPLWLKGLTALAAVMLIAAAVQVRVHT